MYPHILIYGFMQRFDDSFARVEETGGLPGINGWY